MLLTIAIPTYNRVRDLLYNLSLLENIIIENKLETKVCLLVSNNCSTDSTYDELESLKLKIKVRLTVYHQDKNIGLERNFIFIAECSNSDYVMLLGDDDYISSGYLMSCVDVLEGDKSIHCIFGCYKTIDANRKELGGGRDLDLPTKKWAAGLKSAIENTAKFHQMSGIVFKKVDVLKVYKQNKLNNLYPQIFIGTYLCLHENVMQITDYPVLVTQTMNKAWTYGDDGLFQDVFQNYAVLGLSTINRYKLENSFFSQQIWRLWQYKESKTFWKCVCRICFGPNTSFIGSFLFFLRIIKTRLFESVGSKRINRN